MPSPREPGPGAAQPTESAKDSGHYLFERISQDWGKLDFLVHSIAFSPKAALQGRVVDVPRELVSPIYESTRREK
jgi:enoyl-[acyl-carrier-protein] reductase (NADH)